MSRSKFCPHSHWMTPKATKFCEIFTLLLTVCTVVKISQSISCSRTFLCVKATFWCGFSYCGILYKHFRLLGLWFSSLTICRFCLTNVNQEKDLKGKKDWFLLSLYLKERSKGEWREWRSMHGQSSYWTAKSSFIFLTSDHTEAENLGPKLHPGGGFFGPWFL